MKVLSIRNVIRMKNINNLSFEIETDSIIDNIVSSVIKISDKYFYIKLQPSQIKLNSYVLNINSINFDEYIYNYELEDLILNKEITILKYKINNFVDFFNFKKRLQIKKERIYKINKIIS